MTAVGSGGPEARPHDEDLRDRLAAGWSAAEAAAAEAWYYRCAERTFGCRVGRQPWGRTVWTDGIEEAEWNHVSDVVWRDEEIETRLRSVTTWFAGRERAPVVVVTPWSEPRTLGDELVERGWRPRFRHQWSFFDLSLPVVVEPVSGYDYVNVTTAEEMEEWIAVFVSVYDEDGQLGVGYGRGLRDSLTQPGMRHHLIRHAGEPVAVGTLIVEGERAQLFNMVVLAAHRRRGLAEWLTSVRQRQAQEAGARRLTVLSENAGMDRWFEKRGAVPGWFSVGYAPAGA